jgi:hypothetical protein
MRVEVKMTGQRHKMDAIGSNYQDFVKTVLGRIAVSVDVPRQHDYGIDLYCQLLKESGPTTQTVTELFAVQVKGGQEQLRYGGIHKGKWKEYEFTWLKSLANPLYLAHVDENRSTVGLFSLWPLWWLLWQISPHPFYIGITSKPAQENPYSWQRPVSRVDPRGSGHGDGCSWTIDLGSPFLELTLHRLQDKSFREKATSILQTRVSTDHLNLMRYHQFIPAIVGFTEWTTNSPEVKSVIWHFWDARPGVNLPRLIQTASPLLVNLGIHLQWQNDEAAYKLIPILEWFEACGHLDDIGKGLLNGLRNAKETGAGPASMK